MEGTMEEDIDIYEIIQNLQEEVKNLNKRIRILELDLERKKESSKRRMIHKIKQKFQNEDGIYENLDGEIYVMRDPFINSDQPYDESEE
jgi:predicted glycosyl hydrolase (DUF1957 family)